MPPGLGWDKAKTVTHICIQACIRYYDPNLFTDLTNDNDIRMRHIFLSVSWPQYWLIIHPRVLHMGGQPLTVDWSQYLNTTETSETFEPNPFNAERASGKDFEYLLNISESGPIFCRSGGKLLIIAAGHVSSFILYSSPSPSESWLLSMFTLECSIIRMLTEIYDAIVKKDTYPEQQS